MWRRRVGKRGLLLLFSSFVGLSFAEVVVRGLKLVPPYYPPSEVALNLHHTDPNSPVRLTPGWQGYVSGVWTTINEHGFRDRQFPAESPAGVLRIAVVGDSYTMGDGVPLESSYPKQLERVLREREFECEVMNCGISATHTWNQLPILREVLADYSPDFVVLGYNLNDFDNPTRTRFELLADSGQEFDVDSTGRAHLVAETGPWHWRLRRTLFENSHLYRYVTSLRTRMNSDPRARVDALQAWIDKGDHLHSFEAVERMQAACNEAGVPFLVVLLPDTLRLPDEFEDFAEYTFAKEHELVLEHLRATGIDCLDVVKSFVGERPADLEVDPSDPHYNVRGNELVAGAIADHVLERSGSGNAR